MHEHVLAAALRLNEAVSFVGSNHLRVPGATAPSIGVAPVGLPRSATLALRVSCAKNYDRDRARHGPKADIGRRCPPDAAMQLTTDLRAYGFFLSADMGPDQRLSLVVRRFSFAARSCPAIIWQCEANRSRQCRTIKTVAPDFWKTPWDMGFLWLWRNRGGVCLDGATSFVKCQARPRLALNGRSDCARVCPLSNNRQSRVFARGSLSAYDPKRTWLRKLRALSDVFENLNLLTWAQPNSHQTLRVFDMQWIFGIRQKIIRLRCCQQSQKSSVIGKTISGPE